MIGRLSLGASEEEIAYLAAQYALTVEFGLVREQQGVKCIGAGLLSSLEEQQVALLDSQKPQRLPYKPQVAAQYTYSLSGFQPTLFVMESVMDAREELLDAFNSGRH